MLLMTVAVHGYDKLKPTTADIFELTSLFDRGHWMFKYYLLLFEFLFLYILFVLCIIFLYL